MGELERAKHERISARNKHVSVRNSSTCRVGELQPLLHQFFSKLQQQHTHGAIMHQLTRSIFARLRA